MYLFALLSTVPRVSRANICVLFPFGNDVSVFSPIISRFSHLTLGNLVGGLGQQDGIPGMQRQAHFGSPAHRSQTSGLAFQSFYQDTHEVTAGQRHPRLTLGASLKHPTWPGSAIHLQLHSQTCHPSLCQPDRHHVFTEQRCAKPTFSPSHVFL